MASDGSLLKYNYNPHISGAISSTQRGVTNNPLLGTSASAGGAGAVSKCAWCSGVLGVHGVVGGVGGSGGRTATAARGVTPMTYV